jgi:hypothetical protein
MADPAPNEALQKEACDRRQEARRCKGHVALDFKECYFFTAPWRQREVVSETRAYQAPPTDSDELQTSTAFLIAQDFVTEVVNTYMPEAQQWCERGRGMFVPEKVWNEEKVANGTTIKDQVAKDDKQIFVAMKSSNLYSELQKIFYPDLAIGTCGMWIDRPTTYGPISVKATPLRELDVALGPDGEVDDRFVTRHTKNCYVKALLGKKIWDKIPDDTRKAIEDKPADRTEIGWGFWRLWDRDDDECWQHVVLVKDVLVHDEVLVGEGSCPLIVPRFNPTADWAFGYGPMIQGLPDFRQIDELEDSKIRAVGRAINGPVGYPDDSFAAIEQGLEDGFAYPLRPGSEGAVKPIYPQINVDAAIYQYQEMEHRLKKLFFVDLPEQTGDTPPTLGQWLDELARAQRRIGGPGASFYREGPAKIFLRFKYLLEKAGVIHPVTVNGRAVALLPYNPAQRAAEQQEIATNFQAIQILSQAFPEEFKVQIDGAETMKNIIDKMRAKLITFRDKDQIQAAINQIAPLIKGRLGDPAGQVGAPTGGVAA